MRKVIGVMPLYDAEKKSYWIQPRYLQMLEAENAIPLVLPLTTNHYDDRGHKTGHSDRSLLGDWNHYDD